MPETYCLLRLAALRPFRPVLGNVAASEKFLLRPRPLQEPGTLPATRS